jgi:hypothetical protein
VGNDASSKPALMVALSTVSHPGGRGHLIYNLTRVGKLSGKEIDLIITDAIAARAFQRKRQRRIDWKRRETARRVSSTAVTFNSSTAMR